MKGQTTEWEKISVHHIPEKGLYSEHTKDSQNSTVSEQTTQCENGQEI